MIKTIKDWNVRTATLELIDQTIEQYRKIIAIKSYVSYESDLIDRRYLDRLYKLKDLDKKYNFEYIKIKPKVKK